MLLIGCDVLIEMDQCHWTYYFNAILLSPYAFVKTFLRLCYIVLLYCNYKVQVYSI